MTQGEWAMQIAQIVAYWPTAERWPGRTITAYYELLANIPATEVAIAVRELAEDGLGTPPNGGRILKQIRSKYPRLGKPEASPCICGESLHAYRECRSGHPDGWIESFKTREEAMRILQTSGWQVDVGAYTGRLREELCALLVRSFYDTNLANGRPLADVESAQPMTTAGG